MKTLEREADGYIAGYRVLRVLAPGAHSLYYVGHAERRDPVTAVLKVFPADVDADHVQLQVEVLSGIAAGFFPAMLDIATLRDGRTVLVLERLPGPALSHLLEEKRCLEPGEAVTILAPLVVGLRALHDLGFAHTTLSQATVRFQAIGKPVLTGLGGLRRLPDFVGGGAQGVDGATRFDLVRDDHRRLAVLVRAVFHLLDPGSVMARRAGALLSWFEMAPTVVPFAPSLDELERRLFAWATAAPVAVLSSGGGARNTVPATVPATIPARAGVVGQSGSQSHSESDRRRAPGRRRALAAAGAAAVGSRAHEVLERGPVSVLRPLIGRLRSRPLLIVGSAGVAGVLTLSALAALPPSSRATDSLVRAASPATSAPPQTGPPPSPSAPGSSTSGSSASRPSATARTAIAGTDPVAAAKALLTLRAACIAEASVICLDGVDQQGSAALEADRFAVSRTSHAVPGSSSQFDAAQVGTLLEHNGDMALVELRMKGARADTPPASLLMVRGEAGWRLRELIE